RVTRVRDSIGDFRTTGDSCNSSLQKQSFETVSPLLATRHGCRPFPNPSCHSTRPRCHKSILSSLLAAHGGAMIKRLVPGPRAVAHLGRVLLFLAILRLETLTHAQTSPPAVTVQPRNPSVSLGANVTFRATASGAPPLMYQWR